MKSRLQIAMSIIERVHGDQTETFYGTPYVNHCYRVAHRLAFKEDVTENMILAALCHDVYEDADGDILASVIDDIRHFLGVEVHSLIETLTKSKHETYREYISRVKLDKKASTIKLCDLEDHLDPTRTNDVGGCYILLIEKTSLRKRYEDAKVFIESI